MIQVKAFWDALYGRCVRWFASYSMNATRFIVEYLSWPNVKLTVSMLAGAVGFLLAFYLIHVPEGPEHWSADLRTKYFSVQLKRQNDKIVIIEITNDTFDTLKLPYVEPIDRLLLADLLNKIDRADPRAIGLDIIFDRATEPWKDAKLLQSLRKAKARIVLGIVDELKPTSRNKVEYQSAFLANAGRDVGHFYFDEYHEYPLIVSEHVVRLIAKPSDEQPKIRSFAEVLAGKDGADAIPESRFFENRYISWLQPPKDGNQTFNTLPAEFILEQDDVIVKPLLVDKYILIGGNFSHSDRDQHLTPLSVMGGSRASGVTIHAHILAQLLRHDTVFALRGQLQIGFFAVAAGIGFWMGRRKNLEHWHLLIELFGVFVLVVLSVLAFQFMHFIFPFLGIFLSWMAGMTGGHYGHGTDH